jgi:hypothetical protein
VLYPVKTYPTEITSTHGHQTYMQGLDVLLGCAVLAFACVFGKVVANWL